MCRYLHSFSSKKKEAKRSFLSQKSKTKKGTSTIGRPKQRSDLRCARATRGIFSIAYSLLWRDIHLLWHNENLFVHHFHKPRNAAHEWFMKIPTSWLRQCYRLHCQAFPYYYSKICNRLKLLSTQLSQRPSLEFINNNQN